jgi:GNAT superfamily N-acetyltransferase
MTDDILANFDEIDDGIKSDQRQRLASSGLIASGRNPDQFAKANSLSDRLNLPVDVVHDNLTDYEAEDRESQFAALGRDHPETHDFLADPRRRTLVQDDPQGLGNLARTLKFGRTTVVLPPLTADSGNGNIPLRAADRVIGEIYTDKRGMPRRWTADGWQGGDLARDSTLGEKAQGMALSLPIGATNALKSVIDLASLLSGVDTTAEYDRMFRESNQFYESLKPVAYRAEQTPIVQRDSAGGIAGVNIPSVESVADAVTTSIPQIPLFLGTGGGLKGMADAVIPNSPRLAAFLGYGTANAALVAPGQRQDTIAQVRADGGTEDQAQSAGNKAGVLTGLLTAVTGGTGATLAGLQGQQSRYIVQAMLRGFVADAPLEGVEEAGQSAINDVAQGKRINSADALEQGLLAAISGGLPGSAIASIEHTARLQEITRAAKAAKIGERSPADAEAFADAVAGDQRVYIKASDAKTLFQSEALADLVGNDLSEQMASGDVSIPMSKWVSVVSRLPNAEEIVRYGRMSPDGLSAVEIEQMDQTEAENFGKPQEEAKPDTRQQIVDDVTAKLVATNRYTPAQAQSQAKLWGAAIGTLAERSGMDAGELYQRYMGGIGNGTADTPGAVTLNQQAFTAKTKAGEFRLTDELAVPGADYSEFGQFREVVAYDGETRIGSLLYANDGTPPTVEVDPEYRRKGVATAMLKLAKQQGGIVGDRDTGISGKGRPTYRTDDGQAFRTAANEDSVTIAPEATEPQSLAGRAVEAVKTLFQSKKKDGPRGQISIFPDRRMSIQLFEGADKTTFIHESAHFFFEMFRDLATAPDADARLAADFQAALEFMGVGSVEELNARAAQVDVLTRAGAFRDLTDAEKAQIDVLNEPLEKFARGFEAYAAEGKAPSAELRSVFAQFRAWILGVYRSLKALNVELTPEVRGVFDRMLASDEEIEAAQVKQGMQPLATTAKEATALGLTEKQFADYIKQTQDATEEAKADVFNKLNKAWERERLAWWKEERATVREEIADQYEATPAVRALRILNGAKSVDGVEPVPPLAGMKLDKAAIVAEYGDEYLKRLGKTYAKSGGVHPDEAAAVLGFTSGDHLLKSLANAPDTIARIDSEADAIMRERHGDPMTDGTLAEKAMTAAHGNKRVQLLERELEILAKLAGQPAPERRVLKAIAERRVAAKTARQLRPNEYLSAERRAAREAVKAAAKGDYAAAMVAKRQQAVNVALYSAAMARIETNQRKIAFLKKAANDKTRKRVGKSGKSYVDALDSMLEGHEFKDVSARDVWRRTSLREWAAKVQDAGSNTAISPELLERIESENVTNAADLTGQQLDDLHEAVKNLLHLARVKNVIQTRTGQMKWKQAKKLLKERLEQQAPNNAGTIGAADRGILQSLKDLGAAAGNWVLQPETIVEWLDGGTAGPWHDLLWEPSENVEHVRERLQRMVGEKLKEAFDAMPKGERSALDKTHFIESIVRTGPDGQIVRGDSLSGHTILSALFNMGNDGNRTKLMEGGYIDGDSVRQFSQTQLDEMFSKLTAEQAKLVQGVWDAVDSLWPEIVRLEEDMNGIAPEKVIPVSFVVNTKDGPVSMRGGYFPAMYDPRGSKVGALADDEQAKRVLSGQAPMRVSTSKGHVEKRTEFTAPLMLDYHAILTRHLDGAMSDIAYRRFLPQMYRITRDPDLSRMIDTRVGPGAAKALRQGFERGAVGSFSMAGPLFGPFQNIADQTMTNVSSSALGFRVPLALANIATAPILASARVNPKYIVAGYADYYRNPIKAAKTIHQLSPMMLKRAEGRTLEMQSMLSTLRGKEGVRKQMIELAMAVHQWIVPLAENAIWMGAYKQAQAGGMDASEAVRMADKAIRQTQTKHTAKDVSQAEGNPYLRPLMMFAGPLVIINNRLQESGLRGLRGNTDSPIQALGVWLAMAAGGTLIFELIMGRGAEDEDDDGEVTYKDWVRWAARKVGLMPFQAYPILRDAAAQLDSGYARPSPLVDAANRLTGFGTTTIDSGVKLYEGEEVEPDKLAKSTLGAAGVTFGVPSNQITRTGTYLMEVGTGQHTPKDPARDAWYLLQGPPKEE